MKSSASFVPATLSAPRPRRSRLALSLLAAVLVGAAAHAQTATSAVPGFITYQGKVSNPNGTLVGAGTPVNRTVIFRIWSHQSNGTISDLVYSEQQTITISEGEFSVLIGQGTAVTTTPLGYDESGKGPPSTTVGSAAVFGGATRYLGMTIDDPATAADPEVSPRQQLVTSAYAFRAKYAESVGSNGVNVITVLDSGNVGIGSASPAAKLEVVGAIRAGGTGNPGASFAVLGGSTATVASSISFANSATNFSNDAAAGDTVFRTDNSGKLLLQSGVAGAGLVVDGSNRVGIGTAAPNAKLDVVGGMMIKGTLTNASGRPAVGVSRLAAEIGGYGSGGAGNDDGFLRLSAGGGTTATAKTFIDLSGYSSVADMNATVTFGTAGTERMRINNSGLVGIGTSAPNASLDVNGGMMLKGALTNASARPAIGSSRIAAEIGAYGSGGATNDDGFLRLSAGGGTTASAKTFIDLSGYSSVADMDKNITFGTAGVERMRINNGGNVGIGETNLSALLHVGNGSNGLYRGVVINTGWAGNNDANARPFDVQFRGASTFVVNANGRVGIGTGSPTKAMLEVSGFLNLGTINYVYYNSGPLSGHATANPAFSIFGSNVIGCGSEFVIYSDERVKLVEGRSNGAMDLRTLMQIEVTDYRYKDRVAKGDKPQKKVLGQQLERVFPQAVKQTTDAVPDIYQVAAIKEGWIALATDLKQGDRIKLITDDGEKLSDVSAVEPGRFQVADMPKGEKTFVYGREVKDFRTVDYDAVAMLNVSATQEIKREKDAEVASLRADNASLRNANDALTARVAELEAKDRARDAKLASIEKLLSSGQTVMARPASPSTSNTGGQE